MLQPEVRSNLWVNVSFVALLTAALIRFILPMFDSHSLGYLRAGLGWALGFGIFLFMRTTFAYFYVYLCLGNIYDISNLILTVEDVF